MSNRRGMGCGTALVVLIGVSFVCYLAAKMLSPAPTPEERAAQRRVEAKAQAQQQAEQAAQRAEDDEYGSRSLAIALAKNAITNLLKAPSTAKFSSWFKIKHYRGEGEYVHSVVGWVDAQNSFGAMIRNDWVVELEFTPPDDWKITGLVFAGETVIASPPPGRPEPDRRDRPPSREKAAAPSTAIERFEAVFLELNLRLAYEADAVLFRQATDGGGGRLYIDVTDSWLSGSLEDRRSNLDTIYDLWASSQQGPRTTPLAVWIRSPDARIVMRKP